MPFIVKACIFSKIDFITAWSKKQSPSLSFIVLLKRLQVLSKTVSFTDFENILLLNQTTPNWSSSSVFFCRQLWNAFFAGVFSKRTWEIVKVTPLKHSNFSIWRSSLIVVFCFVYSKNLKLYEKIFQQSFYSLSQVHEKYRLILQ